MKSLSFFFPYKVVSGCPVLFLNIARKMASLYSDEYKVYLVDYEDGYMAQNIKDDKNISLIPFKDGERCLIDTDYIIMQAYLPDAIRPEFTPGKETKVLMWVLHAWNFFPIVFPLNFFRSFIEGHEDLYCKILRILYPRVLKKNGTFLQTLHDAGAVAFMDKPTLNTTERALYKEITNPLMIAIASSDPSGEKYSKGHDTNTLHLGWVGRLCDFKIHILNYSMKKAHEYADKNQRNVVFHVVGNGELEHILYNDESDYFKIDRVGIIRKEELDRYMFETFDINFAMGTSVIESAKLGIPTVKVDTSYIPIDGDYVFRWFHEIDGFDVGHRITEDDFQEGNCSFDRIINEYEKQGEQLGEKDYDYYANHFSLAVVSEKLNNSLENVNIRWSEIPPQLLKRGFIRQIYFKRKYGIN